MTPRTMSAYRLVRWQEPAVFVEVEVPRPGPGEVLVRMAGVGLCHSDLHFLDLPAGVLPYTLPFTLGHENAGWIEEAGEGAGDLETGAPVVIAGVHSCGICRLCLAGNDNYCPRGETGRGYGEDGGLAEYVIAPRREVVPLDSLDPRRAAPLTDAGATSYHAVKRVAPKLGAGTAAVVIGAGGLGGFAIQWLRLLTEATVVAVDTALAARDRAQALGANHVAAGDGPVESVVQRVRDAIGDDGAAGVFDFVGTPDTVKVAAGYAAVLGSIALVGAGGGRIPVGWGSPPLECEVFVPRGATIADLQAVVAAAEAGDVGIETELFVFEDAPEAYRRFRAGEIRGRAVVTPNG